MNNDITLNDETEVEIERRQVKKHAAQPMSYYEQKRIRTGKTRKDRDVNGSWKRRYDNNALRGGWSNNKTSPFPHHVCNGLGNSSKRFKVQAGKIVG